MATQKPATHITAAVVSDDFTVTPVELDASRTLDEFYRLINCRLVDVVALDENLDMWVDDEGMCTGSTPNWAITKVAQAYGFTAQPYFGTAVFTGGVDEDGNSVALTPEVLQVLTDLVTE